jgi:uncharacterized protein (TIGR03067 family)
VCFDRDFVQRFAVMILARQRVYGRVTSFQNHKTTMKYLLCSWLIAAYAMNAFAADSKDAEALQGTWLPVKAELGGQPMPDAVLKTISLTMDKGKYDVLADGHPDKGTYILDEATTPKAITITGTEGPNRGKTFPAIYELKDETLKICYDLSGKKRPTAFESVAGTKLYLVTYRRKAAKLP